MQREAQKEEAIFDKEAALQANIVKLYDAALDQAEQLRKQIEERTHIDYLTQACLNQIQEQDDIITANMKKSNRSDEVIIALEEQIASNTKTLAWQNKAIETLTQELQNAKSQLNAGISHSDTEAQNELLKAQRDLGLAVEEIHRSAFVNEDLSTEVRKVRRLNGVLRNKLEKSAQTQKKLQAELHTLQQQPKQNEPVQKALQEKIDAYDEQSKAMKQIIDNLNQEIKQLQDQKISEKNLLDQTRLIQEVPMRVTRFDVLPKQLSSGEYYTDTSGLFPSPSLTFGGSSSKNDQSLETVQDEYGEDKLRDKSVVQSFVFHANPTDSSQLTEVSQATNTLPTELNHHGSYLRGNLMHLQIKATHRFYTHQT